jgi:putative DNA methylase
MTNTAHTYKKLIEVAMPIKEVSAESVRDNYIRHGHISNLHLWWARRPLPVCRASVFASLVPDPDDPNCPSVFREAVELLLSPASGSSLDPYKPYDDIPYTSAADSLPDTARNRLLMFIGKFSDDFIDNQEKGRNTIPKKLLNPNSLIRWESKNDDAIITRARKLIWVANNASDELTSHELLKQFDDAYQAIVDAEKSLYSTVDRHLVTKDVTLKDANLNRAIESFLDRMPRVFDPFAGGGAIPLEAARLGCRSFGNDINPVAHIIQRGSLEFPQRFGKPISFSREEFVEKYGIDELRRYEAENNFLGQHKEVVALPNRLSFEVSFYARKLIKLTENKCGPYYPVNDKGQKPVVYYWARTADCVNPSCRAEIPLLRSFYLCNIVGKKNSKQIYLSPIVDGTDISFEIKQGQCNVEAWVLNRKNLKCPCCGNTTSNKELKNQFLNGSIKERLLAVIESNGDGKTYRLPTEADIVAASSVPTSSLVITEKLAKGNTKQFDICPWGYLEYGQVFSKRQLFMLENILKSLDEIKSEVKAGEDEYGKALVTYLAILVDRIAIVNTAFGIWHTGGEKLERPMGRQAFAMVFDYPESNPFCDSTGSALNQLDWITRYIESESKSPFPTVCNNASSGDASQFPAKYLTAVVTDPPYYDVIAYADLSDFFYVWLKRTLGDVFPLNFAFPQTPKVDECTALKYHHGNSAKAADLHFAEKLKQIFAAIEKQTSDVVSIMFAHQSTEAWTTLCNSILGANMNITGSWANDTEMTSALKTDKAFLSSSVTVSCRPVVRSGYGSFKEVKREIETTVQHEVEELYRMGFRGADLLTACFGQAVSVFGKYERVEKADGSEVSVAELLQLARESAFLALLKGFNGDDFTKFYIAWLQLYGFGEADFDDAAKFSRVGLTINVSELEAKHLFLMKGKKLTLAGFAERMAIARNLGETKNSILIDEVHRALALYKAGNRQQLLQYVLRVASTAEQPFWRVLTALVEVLPAGSDDQTQSLGLLADKESVLREAILLQQQRPVTVQGQLAL